MTGDVTLRKRFGDITHDVVVTSEDLQWEPFAVAYYIGDGWVIWHDEREEEL